MIVWFKMQNSNVCDSPPKVLKFWDWMKKFPWPKISRHHWALYITELFKLLYLGFLLIYKFLGRLFPDWTSFSLVWFCRALSKSLSNWVASLSCILLSSSCWHASWLCWASVRVLPNAIESCSVPKLITSRRLSSENEIKYAGSFLILISRLGEMFSAVSPASMRSNSMLSFISKLAPKLPEPVLPWLKLKPVDFF